MEKLSGKGGLVAALLWFCLQAWAASSADCAKYKQCGAGDLMLYGIIAVGMIPSAYFITVILGIFFPSMIQNDNQHNDNE